MHGVYAHSVFRIVGRTVPRYAAIDPYLPRHRRWAGLLDPRGTFLDQVAVALGGFAIVWLMDRNPAQSVRPDNGGITGAPKFAAVSSSAGEPRELTRGSGQ
jgi:hypothetical protein